MKASGRVDRGEFPVIDRNQMVLAFSSEAVKDLNFIQV